MCGQCSDQHAGDQLLAPGQEAGERHPVGRHCHRGRPWLRARLRHVLLRAACSARHQWPGLCRACGTGHQLCALEVGTLPNAGAVNAHLKDLPTQCSTSSGPGDGPQSLQAVNG